MAREEEIIQCIYKEEPGRQATERMASRPSTFFIKSSNLVCRLLQRRGNIFGKNKLRYIEDDE
jgi:hypothetical protein